MMNNFETNVSHLLEVQALDYFHQGYNCAQSVFAAGAHHCGLSEEQALLISAPFGAGFGRMREICGALSGLSMAIGCHHGNTTPDRTEKEKIFQLTRDVAEQFKSEFGSIYCRDLLDLNEESRNNESALPGERTEAYYANRPCERCVAYCAKLLATYIPQ